MACFKVALADAILETVLKQILEQMAGISWIANHGMLQSCIS